MYEQHQTPTAKETLELIQITCDFTSCNKLNLKMMRTKNTKKLERLESDWKSFTKFGVQVFFSTLATFSFTFATNVTFQRQRKWQYQHLNQQFINQQ